MKAKPEGMNETLDIITPLNLHIYLLNLYVMEFQFSDDEEHVFEFEHCLISQ